MFYCKFEITANMLLNDYELLTAESWSTVNHNLDQDEVLRFISFGIRIKLDLLVRCLSPRLKATPTCDIRA